MRIKYKIDVTKILKEHLFQGKKGKYLSGVFVENRDGRNNYGHDGFITQEVSREARERGEKGPIIGNWSFLETPQKQDALSSAQTRTSNVASEEDEDIPF